MNAAYRCQCCQSSRKISRSTINPHKTSIWIHELWFFAVKSIKCLDCQSYNDRAGEILTDQKMLTVLEHNKNDFVLLKVIRNENHTLDLKSYDVVTNIVYFVLRLWFTFFVYIQSWVYKFYPFRGRNFSHCLENWMLICSAYSWQEMHVFNWLWNRFISTWFQLPPKTYSKKKIAIFRVYERCCSQKVG